jgi:hypothetical protein
MKTFAKYFNENLTAANQTAAPKTSEARTTTARKTTTQSTLPTPGAAIEKKLRSKAADHLTERKKRVAATIFDVTPTKMI